MERDIKEIFADNLRRIRKSRGDTVVDLSTSLGVAQSTISDWENAKKMPRAGAIEKLSEHYHVNKSELLADQKFIGGGYNFADREIPLYGDISAGALSTVTGVTKDNVEYIHFPKQFLGKYQDNNSLFALKVNGQSMNRIIPDGSFVIAMPINPLEIKDDDIVIFSHDGSYSMKRVRKDEEDKVLVFSPESRDRKFRDIVVPYATECDLVVYAKIVWYAVTID